MNWAPLASALSRWVTSLARDWRVSASARVRTRKPSRTSRWIRSKSLIGSLTLNQAAGGVRALRDRHEHHPVLERRVAFEVAVADRALIVQREHDQAADRVERRPALASGSPRAASRTGRGRGRA